MYSIEGKRVWVAGHSGLVGSAVLRQLGAYNCKVLTASHSELDLTRQSDTEAWIDAHKPDAVILAAAHVGGIHANNTYPADFIYRNLAIAQNVIHASYKQNVEKLLFLGSSCIYPRQALNPIQEDMLLTGSLESTNEPYAIAKIAGIKLCQSYRRQYGCDYISAMPCNLYGEGDTYDLQNSHVIPALIMKVHNAKRDGDDHVEMWGNGTPRREFLHVDDLARGLIHILRHYSDIEPINMGAGADVSIMDVMQTVCDVIGYQGEIVRNTSMPDGVMQKLMDSSKIQALGWTPEIDLREGIQRAYDDYLKRY